MTPPRAAPASGPAPERGWESGTRPGAAKRPGEVGRPSLPLGGWGGSIGGALYVLAGAQFLVSVAVAASRYGPPAYSPLAVTVSDLQAVGCGPFQGAYVCSPMHPLANASVGALGLLVAAGSLLIRPAVSGDTPGERGVLLLLVAGAATFANSFTPEDVYFTGDLVTALVAFLAANFGLIQLGRHLSSAKGMRGLGRFSMALGGVGVAGLVIDGFGGAALLGGGGVEWLVIAPVVVWAIVCGAALASRPRPSPRGGPSLSP